MSRIYVETFGRGKPLVMLHGWAMHTGVWRSFAQQLARHFQVICLDLPGHGYSETVEPYTVEVIAEVLQKAVPVPRFALLGWSLGATVAMAMAEYYPDKVQKLIVLAGNPRFEQTPDWPGVKPEILEGFASLLKTDVQQTLTRFLALQINGLSHGKQLLQTIKLAIQECPPPQSQTLHSGLKILKTSDYRHFMLRNHVPISLILGAKDTLIPIACGEAIKRLNPLVELQILDSAGHAPFLSHPEALLAAILKSL